MFMEDIRLEHKDWSYASSSTRLSHVRCRHGDKNQNTVQCVVSKDGWIESENIEQMKLQ